MNYSLFYNHKALEDVLIIVINPILEATRYNKTDDVVTIYHDDEIIGYNLFNISRFIKIHYQGLIVSPIRPLIDLINNVLSNHDLPTLNVEQDSSFIVGEVVDFKNDIYLVDIKEEIVKIKLLTNLSIGQKVVVCKPNTILPNGKLNSSYSLASKAMLMMSDEDEILTLDKENLVGSDFYSGEVKWSN